MKNPSPEQRALARATVEALRHLYPEADCELRHTSALELLVATILSAQSTDATVNSVTTALFNKYRTADAYVQADPKVFEQEIRPTGFFRNKTRSVLGAATMIVEEYGGRVPDEMEALLRLPGVARKTANVVLGTFFNKPTGVVVDTHVRRLAYRIGLTQETKPDKIEQDLMALLPQSSWVFAGHALIWHGRRVCHARKPACPACSLNAFCRRTGVTPDPALR